jgi:hypothetical protein
MPQPEDFYAAEGEPIRPKLRRLVDFVLASSKLTVAGAARVHQYREGRAVVMDPQATPFGGSFQVRVSGAREVTLGKGLVNGLVPRLHGRTIDGLDDNGKPHKEGVPRLELDGPGDNLRSYVALRGAVDHATGEMDAEDKEAVTVVHVTELARESEFAELRPVAEVQWVDRKRVKRVRRIVYFDQQFRYLAGKGEAPGRVQWGPVA